MTEDDRKRFPIKPLEKETKSIQMDLFGQFVTNDVNETSNTIEIWESIPKYFFTPKQAEKLRTKTGHADPFKWEFMQNQKPCMVKVQPALIEQPDGSYKAFFPSVTEEFVEEALKKILASQQYGFHDPNKIETWVRFTLRMIQKELKERARSRSIPEIKHAIEVMNKCNISYFINGKEMWSGAILQDLLTVGRDDYLADTNAHHIAKLPVFISHAINALEYRQHNHDRYMKCDEQLARWIYKKLIMRYVNASFLNSYHFMYSELKQSGLLQQATEVRNREKTTSALNELIERNVIASYTEDTRKIGRKIIDVKYTVIPSSEFISEQKAANRRISDNKAKVIQGQPAHVDN